MSIFNLYHNFELIISFFIAKAAFSSHCSIIFNLKPVLKQTASKYRSDLQDSHIEHFIRQKWILILTGDNDTYTYVLFIFQT